MCVGRASRRATVALEMTSRLVQDLRDFKPCGLYMGSELERHVPPANDSEVHDQMPARTKHPGPLVQDGSIKHHILLVLRKLTARGLLVLILHPAKPETDTVLTKELRGAEERRRRDDGVGARVVQVKVSGV